MRSVLKALTVFNWVTPTLDIIEDAIVGGTPFIMDDANYLKAIGILRNVGYRGGHVAGTFSNCIVVDDRDAAEVERQLNMAGVKWR